VAYIDDHRREVVAGRQLGVEPICQALQVAPSTYYSVKTRPPSRRSVTDAGTTALIERVHAENYSVYGARKVHAELRRRGHRIARCTVERLIRVAGLRGITRAKGPRTTIPGRGPETRPDLVERNFTAEAPNRPWVCDITYCRTFSGWVYAAFVTDVYSCRVVGWQLSKSLRTDLALDALEMAIWTRTRDGRDVTGLTHHSDKGVQYVAIRFTQRLAEAGVVASVDPAATRMTTPPPRRSTPCSRPSSCATRGRGRPRRPRDRDRRVHRLVQPPTPARRDRNDPAGRTRGSPLPPRPHPGYRLGVSSEPPLNPGPTLPREVRTNNGAFEERAATTVPSADRPQWTGAMMATATHMVWTPHAGLQMGG